MGVNIPKGRMGRDKKKRGPKLTAIKPPFPFKKSWTQFSIEINNTWRVEIISNDSWMRTDPSGARLSMRDWASARNWINGIVLQWHPKPSKLIKKLAK